MSFTMIFQFHCNGNIKRLFGLPGLSRLSGPGEIAERHLTPYAFATGQAPYTFITPVKQQKRFTLYTASQGKWGRQGKRDKSIWSISNWSLSHCVFALLSRSVINKLKVPAYQSLVRRAGKAESLYYYSHWVIESLSF